MIVPLLERRLSVNGILNLEGTDVDDRELRQVIDLPYPIRVLRLKNTRVTWGGLEPFTRRTDLEILDLTDVEVTDQDLRAEQLQQDLDSHP